MLHSRQSAAAPAPFDARALAITIAWLRPGAALGQLLAIGAAIAWLRITLPLAPLLAGIALMALATPLAFWRLHDARPVGEFEAIGHVAFDVVLLAWPLYFTGGASNPFITLLLLPVALSAAALSVRGTAVVVALTATLYAVLIFRHVALPDISVHGGQGFGLHLTGMAINFGISILLLAVLIGRMRAALNSQREATQRLRERLTRDEGILAIATQAADAAHQLNTPLSTLRTLLPELERGREADPALREDVRVMTGEVERCRTILRGMVEYGRQQLAGTTQATTLGDYVDASADRFRLLRPEAALAVTVAPPQRSQRIEVQPGLAHALLNLMQNALDASRQNASSSVTLAAGLRDGKLEFIIGDRGNGLPDGRLGEVVAAPSAKPDGLGIGLSLARSAVERMHGELTATSDARGTRVSIRLPVAAGSPA